MRIIPTFATLHPPNSIFYVIDKKSASALNSPDMHKTHRSIRLPFALLADVSYDLEGLGARAEHFSKSKFLCFLILDKKNGLV
jgi:hypothetical protein